MLHQGQIWWEIIKETTRNTNRDLRLSSGWGHWMTPILLYAIYVVLVWSQLGAEEASLQLYERILLLAAPWFVYPLWWTIRLLRTIPEREQRSSERITRMHTFLVPRLHFEMLNDGRPMDFIRGSVVQMHGGDFISNADRVERLICGVVRNTSTKKAHMIEARLTELVGDNGRRLRDSIEFEWFPTDERGSDAQIPAGGERTLTLFRVTDRGIYIAKDHLPLDYAHLFEGGERFTGKLVLEEIYHCSLLVHFVVERGKNDPQVRVVHCSSVANRTPEEYEEELFRSGYAS